MFITIEKEIPAPIDAVFHQFADVNFIPKISGARSKRIQDGKLEPNGVGAVRRVHVIPGLLSLDEEIKTLIPNTKIEYTITRCVGVKSHWGSLDFSEMEQKNKVATKLNYRIDLEAFSPWATKMILNLLKQKISKGLDKYIESLK